MPVKTKITRPQTVSHKKRRGDHHNVGKHYLKTYWPYLPMLLIVGIGLFLGSPRAESHRGVLSYATEMSTANLLDATNKERLANGKTALTTNTTLAQAAQTKAADMAQRNYWSHNTPEGKAPWYFIDTAGYSYKKAGENLAYGFATSKDTVTGWMNSQSHRANLLDGTFTEVGFGFVDASDYNNSGKETIVVAMYGEPKLAGAEQKPAAANLPTDPVRPVNTANGSFTEPATLAVSKIQSLAGTNSPLLTFAIGLLSGAAIVFVLIRHGMAIKRVVIHGEQFIVRHPLVDIGLTGLVMTAYVLGQTTGFIK